VKAVYTIWPADRNGMPATTAEAWHQESRWLVLDITEGLDAAHVVEGPVCRSTALRRELEIRAVAERARKAARAARAAAKTSAVRTEVP
jgi:hypothetical protein